MLEISLKVSFEPEEVVKWVDPFDSISLKLLTILIYIIEILASTILITFVVYETSGLAGHYRTVINQILSCGYGAVRNREISIYKSTDNRVGLRASILGRMGSWISGYSKGKKIDNNKKKIFDQGTS